MANVIRLSKRQLDLLEQFKTIMTETDEIMTKEFPNSFPATSMYNDAELTDLLTYALSSAVYYTGDNLKGLKKGV